MRRNVGLIIGRSVRLVIRLVVRRSVGLVILIAMIIGALIQRSGAEVFIRNVTGARLYGNGGSGGN